MHAPLQAFYLGAGNLNSDPHACMASPPSIEPFPKLTVCPGLPPPFPRVQFYILYTVEYLKAFEREGQGTKMESVVLRDKKVNPGDMEGQLKRYLRRKILRDLSSGGGEGRAGQNKKSSWTAGARLAPL